MSKEPDNSQQAKTLSDFSGRLLDLEAAIEDMLGSNRSFVVPQLLVRRLREEARMPEFATEGAACFDFFALADVGVDGHGAHIPTGLSFAIPDGWVMLIFSRSGHGFNKGMRLVNCVGVIDSDYRGEVQIGLVCDRDGSSHQIKAGDRIAQGMLVPLPPSVEFVEVDTLPTTARGTGGLGSTGA